MGYVDDDIWFKPNNIDVLCMTKITKAINFIDKNYLKLSYDTKVLYVRTLTPYLEDLLQIECHSLEMINQVGKWKDLTLYDLLLWSTSKMIY